MKKCTFTVCFLACVAILLCGCSILLFAQAPTVPDAPLSYFRFSEHHSYVKPIDGYEYRFEDGRHTVHFELFYTEESYAVSVDQAWVDTLRQFIQQYEMMGWNGFKKTASHLLDGKQFFCHFSFADGTKVQASGYGKFPEHYSDASKAIDGHFMQLLPEDMRGL